MVKSKKINPHLKLNKGFKRTVHGSFENGELTGEKELIEAMELALKNKNLTYEELMKTKFSETETEGEKKKKN